MVTAVCVQCQKPFEAYPIRVKQGKARFCKRACYGMWLSENRSGENHPMKGRNHRPDSIAKMRRAQQAKNRTGENSPAWKGGKHISRGYVMVALSLLSETERRLFAPM